MPTFQANTLLKGLLKYLSFLLSLGKRRWIYVWVGINIQAFEFLSPFKSFIQPLLERVPGKWSLNKTIKRCFSWELMY